MTSVTLAVQNLGLAAYLIADSAYCNLKTGAVMLLTGKIIFSQDPAMPFMFATNGLVMPQLVAGHMVQEPPIRFYNLKERLLDAFRAAIAEAAKLRGVAASEIKAGIVGAYWDEDRPEGFCIGTHNDVFPGFAPMEWHDIRSSAHGLPGDFLGRDVDLTSPYSFDPFKDGPNLVAAQRLACIQTLHNDAAPGRCWIGGDVQIAKLTESGVEVFECKPFPHDKVGEPINPAAIERAEIG